MKECLVWRSSWCNLDKFRNAELFKDCHYDVMSLWSWKDGSYQPIVYKLSADVSCLFILLLYVRCSISGSLGVFFSGGESSLAV